MNYPIEKKRIAVVYLGRKGGGAIYSYEMAKGLIENGCEVSLFISKYVENLNSWLSLNAYRTEIITTYKNRLSFIIHSLLFRLVHYRRLKRKYRKDFFDACYIPMSHPWDCYLKNLINCSRIILTLHDPIAHSSNDSSGKLLSFASSLLNWGINDKKPDDIVILSKCFINHVEHQYQLALNHIHVIPHCIFNQYEKLYNNIPFFYDESKTNFLFFGRIDKYKGLEYLARAYKDYIKTNRNSSLTIVGSGDFSFYEKEYENIPNLTVINRWIHDEEVLSFFCEKKNVILVLPYIDATQSGVIPIAMSAGVPIIATKTGGIPEQIEDNVTGFLIPPQDSDSLQKKMIEVSSRDNSLVIKSAKQFINSLTGFELSKKILDIIR